MPTLKEQGGFRSLPTPKVAFPARVIPVQRGQRLAQYALSFAKEQVMTGLEVAERHGRSEAPPV